MNDDLVVQKILKLLENNTAFIGYALNGGIGTKINVRNTETGKTIQALSVNVDSTGEVLVVKDSADNQYKAVTFKTAEKVSERIIQLRKTKPVDDKKEIEYTDSDIEVFYLFVKLIDTGSPVPTQLKSTWIRKGSSCTQFVGAYERCNYASKETIGGTSYTGLPYKPYETLSDCLNDDNGRDARTPNGSSDENGLGLGYKIYSTKMTATQEQNLLAALTSHDAEFNTNFKKQFGYGSILECSGSMYVQGWEIFKNSSGVNYSKCDFVYLPGFTNECSSEMSNAGYCDFRGFIGSKTPLLGQEAPGQPSVGSVDNSWAYQYGWIDLPYEFMYKRHFFPLYVNGTHAQGSFLILEVNEDQTPTIPEGYFPWVPGCPSPLAPGPYDGSGGNRFPEGIPPAKKRDMKLSTHKAEIWLGSNKKKEAIKLYELGVSDLFSGAYNAFISKADETREDTFNRLNLASNITEEDKVQHSLFYQVWNKNILDLRLDPTVLTYIIDNKPKSLDPTLWQDRINPQNTSLQHLVDNIYNRTINLSIVDKKNQVIHLKLGLTPRSNLSNNDCKGGSTFVGGPGKATDNYNSQSWEYQKGITITVKDWKIDSTTQTLNTTLLTDFWNKEYIERKYFTSFGTFQLQLRRDLPTRILLRNDFVTNLTNIVSDNHYEQYNFDQAVLSTSSNLGFRSYLYLDKTMIQKDIVVSDRNRKVGLCTKSWWELWDKTTYNKKNKRLNSVTGYEQNNYQLFRHSGLSPSLDYSSFTNRDFYFGYLPSRPLLYNLPMIRAERDKLKIPSVLSDRKKILQTLGFNFYFSDAESLWANQYTPNFEELPFPTSYYLTTNNSGLRSNQYILPDVVIGNLSYRRFETNMWQNNLWSQFIYDGFVNVNVDSYKNVEFTPPSNPSQYKKYAEDSNSVNPEYNFNLYPTKPTSIETVLSPGTLDITKQVKITKPTNVDLDPNYSFLVYLYPFVEVTKKKKTI